MVAAVFTVIVLGLLNLKYPMDIFSIAEDGGRMILFKQVLHYFNAMLLAFKCKIFRLFAAQIPVYLFVLQYGPLFSA